MDIIVFSNNKGIDSLFSVVNKSKLFKVSIHPVADLKKVLKDGFSGFLYLDIQGMNGPERNKHVKYLSCLKNINYGIIDGDGSLADPAELFFTGASDYIGRELVKKGLEVKRMKSAVLFKNDDLDEAYCLADDPVKKYIFSGDDWNSVRNGYEYTFVFMFIELDNKDVIKKGGLDQATRIITMFQHFLAGAVGPLNGRIWIWKDYGGLVLFPFNGRECDAALQAFKLMLNNGIINSEIFCLDFPLTYRIVMDIGNTVFKKRGDTGTIVSDTINSIFHLGHQFADTGRLYLSREVFRYMPRGLARCFMSAGEFEGREVMRMLDLH